MRNKLTIGIEATANRALSETHKVTKAQDRLSESVQKSKLKLREANKDIANVRSLETLNTNLGFTRGELEKTKLQLQEFSDKQKHKVGLNNRETASLQKHTQTIQELQSKQSKGIDLTEAQQRRLINSRAEYDRLTKKKNSYYQLTKREQKEVEKLKGKLDKLNRTERDQTKALGEVSKKLKVAGLDTNNLAKSRDIANRRAQKTAQLLERENRLLERQNKLQARRREAFSQIGESSKTGLQVGGAAVVAAGVASSKLAIDNEANFVDVAKTLNFTKTEQEIKEESRTGVKLQSYQTQDAQLLRLELNKIAQNMAGVNEADVMAIAAGGANGGIAKEDLAQYTRDTIMTATAWDMTAEEAAQKGMAIRNSFGYKDDDSTPNVDEARQSFMRMSNMINDVANNNGGVSGRDMLGVMSRSGALLTNSGFTEAGALGLAGSLLSKGSTEEEAATATKNISKALTAGFSATDAQKDVYQMIGLDADAVAESMQTDATGTLVEVLEGLKELDLHEQSAAIGELFGQEAAPHVQKLIKDTQILRKIQSDAANASNESVKSEYESIASTNKSKVEETTQSLSRLGIAIGDKLLPIAMPLVEGVGDIASELADFVNESDAAGTAIAGMVGAVGLLGAGFAAYKAFQGVKFARNLAGIASETVALRSANSATDKLTRSLNGYSNAANRTARSRRGEPAYRRQRSSGRSQRRTSRRSGRLSRLTDLIADFGVNDVADIDRGTRRRRGRKRGLIASGVGLLGLGASMPSFAGGLSSASDAIDSAADVAGAASDLAGGLHLEKLAPVAKAIKPLSIGLDAVSMVNAVSSGDTRAAFETGGGILGGMGGAAAGAALGTMIFPVVGTAIGGVIGGVLGDELGGGLGGMVANWFAPDIEDKTQAVAKAQSKEAKARQTPNVTFAPQITVEGGTTSKEDAQIMMQQMQQQLQQFAAEHGLTTKDDSLYQDLNHSLVS